MYILTQIEMRLVEKFRQARKDNPTLHQDYLKSANENKSYWFDLNGNNKPSSEVACFIATLVGTEPTNSEIDRVIEEYFKISIA